MVATSTFPDAPAVIVLAPMLPLALTLPLALRFPPELIFPLTFSLPAIAMFVPLWLMTELLTLALPPLLENLGMKLALHAARPAQLISSGCSADGCVFCVLLF